MSRVNLAKEKVASKGKYVCSRCGREFEWEEMTRGHKAGKVGSYCKGCKSEFNKTYRATRVTLQMRVEALEVEVERFKERA